jgi:hypothetical protein
MVVVMMMMMMMIVSCNLLSMSGTKVSVQLVLTCAVMSGFP